MNLFRAEEVQKSPAIAGHLLKNIASKTFRLRSALPRSHFILPALLPRVLLLGGLRLLPLLRLFSALQKNRLRRLRNLRRRRHLLVQILHQQIDHILHPQRLGHGNRRLIRRDLIVLRPQRRTDQTNIERRALLILIERTLPLFDDAFHPSATLSGRLLVQVLEDLLHPLHLTLGLLQVRGNQRFQPRAVRALSDLGHRLRHTTRPAAPHPRSRICASRNTRVGLTPSPCPISTVRTNTHRSADSSNSSTRGPRRSCASCPEPCCRNDTIASSSVA